MTTPHDVDPSVARHWPRLTDVARSRIPTIVLVVSAVVVVVSVFLLPWSNPGPHAQEGGAIQAVRRMQPFFLDINLANNCTQPEEDSGPVWTLAAALLSLVVGLTRWRSMVGLGVSTAFFTLLLLHVLTSGEARTPDAASSCGGGLSSCSGCTQALIADGWAAGKWLAILGVAAAAGTCAWVATTAARPDHRGAAPAA